MVSVPGLNDYDFEFSTSQFGLCKVTVRLDNLVSHSY